MANIKDLFGLYKDNKVLASKSLNDLAPAKEGANWVRSTVKEQNQVELQIDFSKPENFAHYALAQQYYKDAFSYIGKEFPYDGSENERIEWELGASSFDKYIYEKEYPRTTGYINLGLSYGALVPGFDNGYSTSTNTEYISFKGGPHPSAVPNANLAEYFDSNQGAIPDANYYNEQTNQQSNLELDADVGNTVEFWFKKNSWIFGNESEKQIFVDIWNSASVGSTYGRLRIECDFDVSPQQFSIAYQSGTIGGFLDSNLGTIGQSLNLTGSTWDHYAFTFINSGSNLEAKFYLNGKLNDSIVTGSVGAITGSMLGWLGAMGTTINTPVTGGLGDAKLSGSLDEFRFWKTKRNSEEIGRNWFTQVGGGTNTDVTTALYAPTKYSYTNPVDLGVYYKFNEGIINTSSFEATDAKVLDYSGRITNGSWVGYSVGSRNTGSAMVAAGAAKSEFQDPILYSFHPSVSSKLDSLVLEGFNYDINNNAALYNSLLGWIIDDDCINERYSLFKLTQIMGSYFDILQLQTERLPRLKDVDYTSASFKPLPFANRLLDSCGIPSAELFTDATALEALASRDDFRGFAEKLDETKSRIYKNIYNNLVYVFKSKGTEKSIRNLIRCYGIGNELVKLNLYGDEVTYDIKENYVSSITRKHYANFNTTASWEASVFQTSSADATPASTLSYISSSADQIYHGITFQFESLFAKQVRDDNISWWSTTFSTSSLAGCHTPLANETDLTWQTPDVSNFQVYAVRPSENDKDARFVLSSSAGGVIPTLTSSLQTDVYDNSRWNIAVRVKPTKYPWSNAVLGSTATTYDVEFLGYNNVLDSTDHFFKVTSSLSLADGQAFLSSSKRLYVGAHRTNFTGTVLQRSDAKISSVRYWMDYLDDKTILAHAKDPSNFGRYHPGQNTFLNQLGNSFAQEVTRVPEIETLALQWDFGVVTGSDAAGEFFVGDYSSGSVAAGEPYGSYGSLVKRKHPGRGIAFPSNDIDAAVREYVYTAKQVTPEVINSSDMVEIRNDSDIEIFTRDTRPIRFFFAVEKSMNAIISEEMIKLFATVMDFNNLIGEPVNRYRQDYKSMEKMRQLFFERVQNDTIDFEKFVDYYKWVDESIGKMVVQLFPASANFSPKVFTMIESHVLERNKYWTKFPTLEMKQTDPEAGLYGISEMLYPYKRGGAPIPLVESSHCVWAHERAESETFSSGNPIIDDQRNTFREANDFRPTATPATLTDIASGTPTQYAGSTYALRNFTKIVRLKAKEMPELKGGSNVARIKNIQYAHTELPFGATTQLKVMSSEVESDIDCNDVVDPNDKVKLRYKLTNNPISYLSGKGNLFAPFDLFSSSVSSGYQASLAEMGTPAQKIALNNYHDDFYGNDKEIPMQGPFTEKYVGGWVHRHVPFPNTDCPSTGSLATGLLAEECRPEAWNLDIAFDSGKSVLFDNGAPPFAGESLDITSDDGTVANFPFGGADFPFTMTAWFKTGTDGDYSVIIGRCGWPGFFALNGDFRLIEMFGQLRFDVWDAGGNLTTGTWTTNNYDDGNWHFACFGWESDQAFLFVDGGAEVLTHFCSGRQGGYTAAPPQPEDFRLRFGELQPTPHVFGTAGWNGSLSSVAFWPSGLDATQAIEFYNNGCPLDLTPYTGPPGNLQAWWRMGDAPGDSTDSADPSARIYDVIGGYDATPTVMVAGNIKEDSPPCATGIGNLTLTSRTAHQARSTILREPLAKRPVNIRNIKQTTGSTIIGNYTYDYEVLQTSGRKINNRFFVKNGGFDPILEGVGEEVSPWIDGLITYALPDFSKYGATKNIFVERFNAPGGPEVSSRGALDLYAEEYAIYNDLNWRNLSVRQPLNQWSTEHCGPFGIDPTGSPGDGTTPEEHAVRACCYTGTIAAYHKVNRNPKTIGALVGTSSTEFTTSVQYDNWFVQHQIPRSELQYAWINASYDNTVVQPFGLLGSGDGGRSNFTVPVGNPHSEPMPQVQFITSASSKAWASNTLFFDGANWSRHYPECGPNSEFFNSSSLNIPAGLPGLGSRNSIYASTLSPAPFGAPDDVAYNCSGNPISISFWMKVTSSHPNDRTVVSRWYGASGVGHTAKADWRVYVGTGIPSQIIFEVMDVKGLQTRQCTSSVSLNDVANGDWHHVAATLHSYDGAPGFDCTWIQQVYIDGDNKGESLTTTDNRRVDETATFSKFYIGAQYDVASAFDNWFAFGEGWLDEVSVWQGIQGLSQTQVEQIHNGTPGDEDGCPNDLLTAIDTPPIPKSWWRMGDTFGDDPSTTIIDVQGNYDIEPLGKPFAAFEFDVPGPCAYNNLFWNFTASLDFVGLNTYIYDPIIPSENLVSASDGDYENRSWAYLCPRTNPAVDGLHALLLHRNGPYQYPSWKQIRTGETPIARYQKKNNIITVGTRDRTLFTNLQLQAEKAADPNFVISPGWYRDNTKITHYTEPMVTFKYVPFQTELVNVSPSLVPNILNVPVTFSNTFCNNIYYFANTDLTDDFGLGPFNRDSRVLGTNRETQMHDLFYERYRHWQLTGKFDLGKLNYAEWIFPREIYTGLAENRGRTKYAETASVTVDGFAIASYGSNGIDRNSSFRRTFWKDNWRTRNRRKTTLQNYAAGIVVTGSFDYRTTLSSSLEYTDGWASSIWPMGSNQSFHNTSSTNTMVLLTPHTSSTGGDFGELNRLNYDSLISLFNSDISPGTSTYLSSSIYTATCPLTEMSDTQVLFSDLACNAQEIFYDWTWLGGVACCGWNHALWDTSSAEVYLGTESCPASVGGWEGGCYTCDSATAVYTSPIYTIGKTGHYEFQPVADITSVAYDPWCVRGGLQPSGTVYLASSGACVTFSDPCYDACLSPITGANDYTMVFSIMVGAQSVGSNPYNIVPWSYSAWVSSSVNGAHALANDGRNVCRFLSAGGITALNPETDKYRIMRSWNQFLTSSELGPGFGLPFTQQQVNLQREILFQRNTGSCWETFHTENINTLFYDDTSIDGGSILTLPESVVALNQSYYGVVDFSGSNSGKPVSYKSASMTNYETDYSQNCPESLNWTASISYTYPAGFTTNDTGYYTSSTSAIYKDYGLMWNVTNERKRMYDMGLVDQEEGVTQWRYPSYDSYEDYARDVRVMGKEYSIMPEFRMSSMMGKADPYSTQKDYLELPGGRTTSSVTISDELNVDFFKEYSNSDFLKEFDFLMNQQKDSADWMTTNTLSLTCKAVKKLLPYDGFYPMNRTTQLATLFNDAMDYSSSAGQRTLQLYRWTTPTNCFVPVTEEDYNNMPSLDPIRKQGITTPFFAPGIIYNSIKSGVAVGWTLVTGSCLSDAYVLQNVNTSSISGSEISGDFLNTVVYKDPSLAQKISFETIYNIDTLIHKDPNKPTNLIEGAFHIDYPEVLGGQFGLDVDCGITGCVGGDFASTNRHFMLSWNGDSPAVKTEKYNLAMNNFLSECVRFFLRDPENTQTLNQGQLNYFQSQPVSRCNFVSGATYYMDVILQGTENDPFTMCRSGFNKDDPYASVFTALDPVARAQAAGSTFPEHEAWTLPPEIDPPQDGRIHNLLATFDGRYFGPATQKWKNLFNYQTASEGAHYNVSDPAQAPYTPPYYYGQSIARIKYKAGDEWVNPMGRNPIDVFRNKMEIEFSNPGLLQKIQAGNLNIIADTPDGAFPYDTFSTASFAYKMAQNVGDSINLKGRKDELGLTFDGVGRLTQVSNTSDPQNSRYVVSTKFECPILDFTNQEAQTMTVEGGLHPPTSLSSSGFLDNTPIRLGKGMWSGYGVRDPRSSFVTLGLRNSDSSVTRPVQTVNDVPDITTSLIDAFGFNINLSTNDYSRELGVLADRRMISEAVVAIPFTTQPNVNGTFDHNSAWTVDPTLMPQLSQLLNGTSPGGVNLFRIEQEQLDEYRSAPSLAGLPANSITDMIKNMNEFVIPPPMDFVQNSDIPPFVMYIFKFEQELNKVDLQDIWQGVLPRIGVRAEMDEKTISHSLLDDREFFHGYPPPSDVRWFVFKIKKRGTMKYSEVTQWSEDDAGDLWTHDPRKQLNQDGSPIPNGAPNIQSVFSYNWPHDFYSLIELGKVKTDIEFKGTPSTLQSLGKSPAESNLDITPVDISEDKG